MDDLLAAALEAGFKLAFGAFCFLVGPFLVLYYAFLALRWCLNELHKFWAAYGTYVLGTMLTLVAVLVISILVAAWWDAYRIKFAQRRALRQLQRRYREATGRMDQIGRVDPESAP